MVVQDRLALPLALTVVTAVMVWLTQLLEHLLSIQVAVAVGVKSVLEVLAGPAAVETAALEVAGLAVLRILEAVAEGTTLLRFLVVPAS